MRNVKRVLGILLCMTLLTPLSVHAAPAADTAEDKASLQNAQNEKKDMESTISGIKNEKKDLEEAKESLSDYVVELDGQLMDIQDTLSQLESMIAEKQQAVTDIKQQLREAEETEANQYASMKQRIKFMYEKGNTTYVSILFNAENFSEMLNKAEYIEEISGYDRSMLSEYQNTKTSIAQLKTQLEDEQKTLEAAQEEATGKESEMSELIDKKNDQIEDYESDISNKEKAIKEYESDLAAQNATIAALEAKIAKAEKEAMEGVSGNGVDSYTPVTYSGGAFCFPCPSYTRVSDDYGYRIHPTLGVRQFHNGVDLAAPSGSPILAAQDGVVIAAAYSSTMGNYIMINHGDGIYTIYMHASSLYVSTGQSVSKGQKIAAVGSTGRSTGPHLHFSVRVNGSYVSPWSYL